MPLSRLGRDRAAARLVPALPVIGFVVALNAVGLAPAAVAGTRAA